jgi:hypothetical protein
LISYVDQNVFDDPAKCGSSKAVETVRNIPGSTGDVLVMGVVLRTTVHGGGGGGIRSARHGGNGGIIWLSNFVGGRFRLVADFVGGRNFRLPVGFSLVKLLFVYTSIIKIGSAKTEQETRASPLLILVPVRFFVIESGSRSLIRTIVKIVGITVYALALE